MLIPVCVADRQQAENPLSSIFAIKYTRCYIVKIYFVMKFDVMVRIFSFYRSVILPGFLEYVAPLSFSFRHEIYRGYAVVRSACSLGSFQYFVNIHSKNSWQSYVYWKMGRRL